ncbi:MAG: sugar phosphate isomerase/epimerase [Burkholderiales bacterium]|jgi:sugar phosphate isomerase/epimerase|nr:sugar phosphate isomerase/epimerase [Burkholderiales bacterium]
MGRTEMRCAFSSIAWTADQATGIARLLRANGAAAIEASPALFTAPLDAVTPAMAKEVRAFWEDAGLPIVAMQSLLFGKPNLSLFQSAHERTEMAQYLRHIFRLAGSLGAIPLIFGSPGNRKRKELSPENAFETGASFFAELAPYAQSEGVVLCIEANAEAYGCDFITTHAEAAQLVKTVNHPGFGLQIDTGVMQMNGEAPDALKQCLTDLNIIPSHVHISQPFLEPVVSLDVSFHQSLYQTLCDLSYPGIVSIEMKRPEKDQTATILRDALSAVIPLYSQKR